MPRLTLDLTLRRKESGVRMYCTNKRTAFRTEMLCYAGVREVWPGLPPATSPIVFHASTTEPHDPGTTYRGTYDDVGIGAHAIMFALSDELWRAGFRRGDIVTCWIEY